MSYININNSEIQVGKALREDLFYKIKNNLDDHETRLALAVSGNRKVEIFNLDVILPSYYTSLNGLLYHECLQDLNLIEGAIQLFDTNGIVVGSLNIDVKKNTTPNDTGMTSVFITPPNIDMPTATDYQRATGVFNTSYQALLKGDILRLDITAVPLGLSRFRVLLIGEV